MIKARIFLAAATAFVAGHAVQAASLQSTSATTTYDRAMVDGVGVFYREPGGHMRTGRARVANRQRPWRVL